MGQFLPKIRNVFEEIRKYKGKLEERINLEIIDCNSNETKSYEANSGKYIAKETHRQ